MSEREMKIAELLERVKAATGPDRELDANLWEALIPGASRKKWSYLHEASGKLCEVDETRDETRRLITVPAYTSSIDAATALIERVMGERWGWSVDRFGDAFVGGTRIRSFEIACETPAMALIAALLTALSDPAPANEGEAGR